MLQNYAANLHKGVPAGVFPHKGNACSLTTPLIALPCFHLLDCKRLLQVFKFLNDTLLHMQPEVLTLDHLKCLNKVLKCLSHKFHKIKRNCIPKKF